MGERDTQELLYHGIEGKHICGGHRSWGVPGRGVKVSPVGGDLGRRRRDRATPAPREAGT